MQSNKESPEEMRERLRQEELRKTSSSIHGSNLADLTGGLSWKFTGVIILLLIIATIVYFLFF